VTDELRALVSYRLLQSRDALRAAEKLLESGLWRDAINRCYYVQFYSVLALLALKGLGSSKHSGVISLFDREFVKAGVFSKELSLALHSMFDLRQEADYEEMASVGETDARAAHGRASQFLQVVGKYLGDALSAAGGGPVPREPPALKR
jgi:uncharacterized protein (UPF0332 family)